MCGAYRHDMAVFAPVGEGEITCYRKTEVGWACYLLGKPVEGHALYHPIDELLLVEPRDK